MSTNLTPELEAQHHKTLEAYYDHKGNKAEAARSLGLSVSTYKSRIKQAERDLAITLKPLAHGSRGGQKINRMKLPKKGQFKHYIVTSVQNNTEMHPGFHNLEALAEWYDALDGHECELLVSKFTYNKAAYGSKAVKPGTQKASDTEDLWYDPYFDRYTVDEAVELTPNLVFCANFNIIPTARYPLTGLEAYMGRRSIIVPHAKMAQKGAPSMKDEAAKQLYSTGASTLKNYIQKRAGNLAEAEHDFGGLIVSVDWKGRWHIRFLEIGEDDSVQDIGPMGYKGLHVQAGIVMERNVVAAINWGDVHASEIDPEVRDMNWGEGGILDTLCPQHQTMNDLYSHRSRSHHEQKRPFELFEKFVKGQGCVEGEVEETAEVLAMADRDWCSTHIIGSNHDRHLDQWLDETDLRWDALNWRYGSWLNYNRLKAVEDGVSFNTLEFALREKRDYLSVVFLPEDESLLICGIEFGLHGDRGPNGARGSTRNLTRLARKVNKGHDHQATRELGVISAGACALDFKYMKGPGSHSIAHTLTYENGARTNIVVWQGTWRF